MAPEELENSIVRLYWERDEQAIALTEKHYGGFVFSICRNILRERRDAEECCSTTYLKMWNSIPPERPNSFTAFIARAARMTAIDRLRERTRQKRGPGRLESLDDLSEFLTDDLSVADEVEARELGALINSFVSSLEKRERVLFVKRYYFNTPVKTICRELGVPRSTAYSMISSIKERLKKLLEKEGYLQ